LIRTGKFTCALLLAAACAVAAENPFIGKWKLDPSKSQFTGTTFKWEDAGNGKVRWSSGNESMTFTTDGKEHPGLYGRMVTVKQIDPKTWERTTRLKGKVVATATDKLSDDGKTLTEEEKGTHPDGSSYHETDTFERVGDGSGFFGTWKTTKVDTDSSQVMSFAPNGEDGVNWDIPSQHAKCALKFDGKDHPASGPRVPKGLTLAATKTGDRSFDFVEKIGGKEVYKGNMSVSDDGKTLTSKGSAAGVNEPTTEVYDKQ